MSSSQIVCITGASRGIGRALVEQFANAGHTVLAIARNEGALKELSTSHRGKVIDIPMDITTDDPSYKIGEVMKGHDLDRLDILINNAGLLVKRPFNESSDEDWERMFEVNLMGVVRMTRWAYTYLIRSNSPHVLNISSMAGFQGSVKFPGMVGYSSSKAALGGLTEGLAVEWGDDGVRVNCLALGAVDTEMFREAFPEGETQVSAEKMAGFILNFAVEGGKVMTGKIVPVSLSTP